MASTHFYCDCTRYCNGERRQVSQSTFYVHKRKRDPTSRFSAPMQAFLKKKPILGSATATSTLSDAGPSQRSRRQEKRVPNHTASNAWGDDLVQPGQGGTQEAYVPVSVFSILKQFNGLVLRLSSRIMMIVILFSGSCLITRTTLATCLGHLLATTLRLRAMMIP
jgi:hypothetical protein